MCGWFISVVEDGEYPRSMILSIMRAHWFNILSHPVVRDLMHQPSNHLISDRITARDESTQEEKSSSMHRGNGVSMQ